MRKATIDIAAAACKFALLTALATAALAQTSAFQEKPDLTGVRTWNMQP